MKKIHLLLFAGLALFALACSDGMINSEGETKPTKWPFVKHSYQYRFTLQNTTGEYFYKFHFINNDSVDFIVERISDGERLIQRGGHYEMKNDYDINFLDLDQIPTTLKGRRVTIYNGSFNRDYTNLQTFQRTYFNTGNSNSGSPDYELVED